MSFKSPFLNLELFLLLIGTAEWVRAFNLFGTLQTFISSPVLSMITRFMSPLNIWFLFITQFICFYVWSGSNGCCDEIPRRKVSRLSSPLQGAENISEPYKPALKCLIYDWKRKRTECEAFSQRRCFICWQILPFFQRDKMKQFRELNDANRFDLSAAFFN